MVSTHSGPGSIAFNPQAAAEVATGVLRLEMDNDSSVMWLGTVAEYRIDWGPRRF
jgi:hypothetical protein